MQCANTDDCLKQIVDYFDGPKLDQFLFVNVQNGSDYLEILRQQYGGRTNFVYVSDFCEPDDFPFVEGAISAAAKEDFSVLVGLSQALMLRGEQNLDEKLNDVLYRSTKGNRCMVLLLGCENYLKKFLERDQRLSHRVILVKDEWSPLPKISLSEVDFHLSNVATLHGIKELLYHLERENVAEIRVVSAMSRSSFGESCYQIAVAPSNYVLLTNKFSDLRNAAPESFGTDDEWKYLTEQASSCPSFTDFICKIFGSTTNLSAHLKNVMRSDDATRKWLLWLALKIFDDKSNNYLSRVLRSSTSASDFPERIYLELANVDANDKEFSQLYDERKILLEDLGKGYDLSGKYCQEICSRKKDEIFYLTDRTKEERTEFFRCLEEFNYSDAEIARAVKMSKSLASYMEDYDFNLVVNGLPDNSPSFADELTAYFKEYKLQKLTNKIHPEFLEKVKKYAESRPYNKVQARSSIVPQNLAKEKCKPFFFDALGVEFLGFILDCCKKNGMEAEISVGRCLLPSTTEVNKPQIEEECKSWGQEIPKISALDNIKHNDEEYNYERQKLPVHLFFELFVIENELKKIHDDMMDNNFDKALIVSDHGASRLAVLYSTKNGPIEGFDFDEKGEKSGRYVRVSEESPKDVPFMDYEDEFAVVANYDRVRGGRRATVEVHGGASLEEVLVPVIVLSKKSDEIIRFTNSEFVFKRHEDLSLELYFSGSLTQPRLLIDGQFYDGERTTSHHMKFTIPEPVRKTYVAYVYDGEKNLARKLEFTVKNASLANVNKLF